MNKPELGAHITCVDDTGEVPRLIAARITAEDAAGRVWALRDGWNVPTLMPWRLEGLAWTAAAIDSDEAKALLVACALR